MPQRWPLLMVLKTPGVGITAIGSSTKGILFAIPEGFWRKDEDLEGILATLFVGFSFIQMMARTSAGTLSEVCCFSDVCSL